jgi:hypothetical protein
LKGVLRRRLKPLQKNSLWIQNATTGAEAPLICGFYAALKRRSSTVLHASAVLHSSTVLHAFVSFPASGGDAPFQGKIQTDRLPNIYHKRTGDDELTMTN